MSPFRTLLLSAAGLGLAATALTGPAGAQPRYDGYGPRRGPELVGPGVPELLPELRETPRGRAFVLDRFDFDRDGVIDLREARAADRAFLRRDRGAYGRDRYDDDDAAAPPPPPPPREGGWDRDGMRGYHFRQNRYGAVFTVGDVLFRTGSAELRPEAEARLRPLADYLRAEPGVRVRIDGFTDAVGSDASNLRLSQERARSVAAALEDAGVREGRLQLEGHGESSPVATNATDAGRRLNRRVEVTLVGQRADRFN